MNKIKSSIIRAQRVRAKIKPHSDRFRLTIFRSNKYLYAQIIDSNQGKTIVSSSDIEKKLKNQSKEKISAKNIGVDLAKKATAKNIKKIYFDRGPHSYHGRIKELAEGVREGGLIF